MQEQAMPDVPVVLDVRVVTGTGGGPDKTILNAPRFLAAAGYHNICAYMHPPDDPGFERIRERANALGAPLVSIADRGPFDQGRDRTAGTLPPRAGGDLARARLQE